jgi:hypothetical protein
MAANLAVSTVSQVRAHPRAGIDRRFDLFGIRIGMPDRD